MISRVKEKLRQLPDRPGVYLFKDRDGKVLYVGKAISLRKRVLSYFQPSRPLTAKLMQLVQQTTDLEWINTGSEAEALLYESSMIKEKQPKYNVSLRDDKSYPYLKVTIEPTASRPKMFDTSNPSTRRGSVGSCSTDCRSASASAGINRRGRVASCCSPAT